MNTYKQQINNGYYHVILIREFQGFPFVLGLPTNLQKCGANKKSKVWQNSGVADILDSF